MTEHELDRYYDMYFKQEEKEFEILAKELHEAFADVFDSREVKPRSAPDHGEYDECYSGEDMLDYETPDSYDEEDLNDIPEYKSWTDYVALLNGAQFDTTTDPDRLKLFKQAQKQLKEENPGFIASDYMQKYTHLNKLEKQLNKIKKQEIKKYMFILCPIIFLAFTCFNFSVIHSPLGSLNYMGLVLKLTVAGLSGFIGMLFSFIFLDLTGFNLIFKWLNPDLAQKQKKYEKEKQTIKQNILSFFKHKDLQVELVKDLNRYQDKLTQVFGKTFVLHMSELHCLKDNMVNTFSQSGKANTFEKTVFGYVHDFFHLNQILASTGKNLKTRLKMEKKKQKFLDKVNH